MTKNLMARKLRGSVNYGTMGAGNGTAALQLGVEIVKAYNELADKHNALVAEVEALKAQREA